MEHWVLLVNNESWTTTANVIKTNDALYVD